MMEHIHGVKSHQQAILSRIKVDNHANDEICFDTLTQLPNYYDLEKILTRELSRAKRHKTNLALLFIDLDNFKHINTSLGHPVGNKVLCKVAEYLKSSLRREDVVASPANTEGLIGRLSDDEFVVMLTNLKHGMNAANYAKRLLSIFSQPININNEHVYVSLSIGIAVNEIDISANKLIRHASIAMHRAKKSKNNKIEFFTKKLSSAYKRRANLENWLHDALDNNYFYLVYQPQYQLNTGKICGIETLIRWRHPEFGLISPDEFIPVAETTNLISTIGEWVLAQACQQYCQWQTAGLINSDIKLSVNISPYQLRKKSFVRGLCKILDDTGINPHNLIFEITESGLMTDLESLRLTLYKIQNMGIHLAIDDFGKGQSSLSRIIDMPVHTLKIDKSFVLSMKNSRSARVIVKSIIALGKALELTVVAEGVETQGQLAYLMKSMCPIVQGYFFSKAINADKLTKLLKSQMIHPMSTLSTAVTPANAEMH